MRARAAQQANEEIDRVFLLFLHRRRCCWLVAVLRSCLPRVSSVETIVLFVVVRNISCRCASE